MNLKKELNVRKNMRINMKIDPIMRRGEILENYENCRGGLAHRDAEKFPDRPLSKRVFFNFA